MSENFNMELAKNTYIDELIRENARLTVQHEADVARLEACEARLSEAVNDGTREALEACGRAQERARVAEVMLGKAIKDLHFVMAGGDPCKVCAKVCMMGEGNCQPVWTGEKTED